jgi:serine/threonine-protein kinase RsbW
MTITKGETLNISSSSENMIEVEKLVDNACDAFNVNEDFYGNILIAVTAAVNNAMHYGNEGNPNKQIKIAVESDQKKIKFLVTDEGNGFDYNELPDPTDPLNIDKPQGTGIFLMKHLADKVEFNNKGKEVLLTFNLN